METAYLKHRSGGTITRITHVAHETYKGVASWHFIGDVVWGDTGKESHGVELSPFTVCHDGSAEGIEQCNKAHAALTDYLGRVGEWHDTKHKKDGRCYSWTPRNSCGRETI